MEKKYHAVGDLTSLQPWYTVFMDADMDFVAAIKRGTIASLAELKARYRALSKRYHPDLARGDDYTGLFLELQDNYERALAHPFPAHEEQGQGVQAPPADRDGGTPDLLDLHAALMAKGWPGSLRDPPSRRRRDMLERTMSALGIDARRAETQLQSCLEGSHPSVDRKEVQDILFLVVSQHFNPTKALVLQWQRRGTAVLRAMRSRSLDEAAAYLDILARCAGLVGAEGQ